MEKSRDDVCGCCGPIKPTGSLLRLQQLIEIAEKRAEAAKQAEAPQPEKVPTGE